MVSNANCDINQKGYVMIRRVCLSILFSAVILSTECEQGVVAGQVGAAEGFVLPVIQSSPSGNVEVTFSLAADRPVYSVKYKGKEVIAASGLQICFKQGGALSGLGVTGVARNSYDETYDTVVGKSKQTRNHCNEMIISLAEKGTPSRKIDLVFRAYDDGAAFRYVIPKQKMLNQFEIVAENSEFNFAGDYNCWALQLGKFTTNYEKTFDNIKVSAIEPNAVVGLPLTVEIEGGPVLAVTEADLTDYAGMYLAGKDGAELTLVSKLSPLPDVNDVCVRASSPHKSPWRVIMTGDKAGDLVESNIILNLNETCAIADTSWIKAGKVAWPWWSGRVVTDVNFKGDMNTETQKYYIDFAAENGLEYLLIDAKWYGDHHDKTLDITKTIPEINMPEIISYANARGVDVLIWLNWENTRDQMDTAFPLYEKWGIKGVKIDYMNRDDQEVVNFYQRVLKKAAEHRLVVDFHGAYKPTGIRRTWPNLITREGVLGLEHTKWSKLMTPEHNVTIPFTRMLAGPMDYTPGGFDNVTREKFVARQKAPMVMGTRCHHLAMFVVYESPLQMLCDHPAAYRGQDGIEFLKVVPASWDETKVLDGKIGDYIVMARKRGKDWFIGAMTDWNARVLEVGLGFLGEGEYEAEIYSDGPGAGENPKRVMSSHTHVSAGDKLVANLASGGGYAVYLRPIE